jgi:cytoplasmic iron level regulating protein YaaA (DUF328/UPF0246 family)
MWSQLLQHFYLIQPKLIKELKTKEPKDIASLMGLSDKLATLNFDRYQSWSAAKKMSSDSPTSIICFSGRCLSRSSSRYF